jgi:hypothetical protein
VSISEKEHNRWTHEYRERPSILKLVLGFSIWFFVSAYCVFSIVEVANATAYLDVSRFSYFLYQMGGKNLLYCYFGIIPASFVLVGIKLLLNFLKHK